MRTKVIDRMMRCIFLFRVALMITLIQFPLLSKAEEQGIGALLGDPIDRNYVAFGIAFNEFRSVELVLEDRFGNVIDTSFPLTAQTYAASLTLGTYITENFKTELRAGMGVIDDTLEEAMDIMKESKVEIATYFATEPKPGQESVKGKSLSTVFGIPMQVSGKFNSWLI